MDNFRITKGPKSSHASTDFAQHMPALIAVRDIPTIAVGLLGDAFEAEPFAENGDTDFIALARGAINDPNWPLHANREHGGVRVFQSLTGPIPTFRLSYRWSIYTVAESATLPTMCPGDEVRVRGPNTDRRMRPEPLLHS